MNKYLSNYFNSMLVLISISSLASIILLFKHARIDRTYYNYFFMPAARSNSNQTSLSLPLINNSNMRFVKCHLLNQKRSACVKASGLFGDLFLPFEILRKKFDVSNHFIFNEKLTISRFENSKTFL